MLFPCGTRATPAALGRVAEAGRTSDVPGDLRDGLVTTLVNSETKHSPGVIIHQYSVNLQVHRPFRDTDGALAMVPRQVYGAFGTAVGFGECGGTMTEALPLSRP